LGTPIRQIFRRGGRFGATRASPRYDGRIAAVFATDVEPADARVINAIAKELPRPE
jgi:hypothetical protein